MTVGSVWSVCSGELWLYGVSGVSVVERCDCMECLEWRELLTLVTPRIFTEQSVGTVSRSGWRFSLLDIHHHPILALTSVEDVSTYIIWAPKQQQMCHLCCHTTCPATTYKERRQFVTRPGRGNDWTFLGPKCEATSPDCPSIGCPRANLIPRPERCVCICVFYDVIIVIFDVGLLHLVG